MKHKGESQGTEYRCAYCGEVNHTFVDPSQGKTQKYIEDCQVCCQPNELSVSYDTFNKEFIIQSHQSQ
ncbi:CPXCG motif-containing cysteine-rich protein [Fodinibius sp. SL11]|uniref:CPXCG motif-containing cysteine-rich protein n=1 Tax=Fodinibius sp. SL11 TaxID=3425690 RepID=UPI003F880D70